MCELGAVLRKNNTNEGLSAANKIREMAAAAAAAETTRTIQGLGLTVPNQPNLNPVLASR